jgi:hypothetical protein
MQKLATLWLSLVVCLPVALAQQIDGKFISAFVRATKAAGACCAPGCCA